MNITERHQLILVKLQEEGSVIIQELSNLMDVSEVTIRKDLKLLEEKKLLFITKGGASLNNPYMNERTINEKELLNWEEKQKIAKAALSLIEDGDSIIIGSGTTVFQLSKYLHEKNSITVITPALKVALELSNRPSVEVVQLGGAIRQNSSSVAGSDAERTLKDISCGTVFLGVDGIDLDFGLSITNLAEARLNKAMIESAQKLVVMADSTKLGRRGLGKVCDLEQVHYIITDDKIPPATKKLLEERNIKVIVAII